MEDATDGNLTHAALDGHDVRAHLAGQGPSPTREFFYLNGRRLEGVRVDVALLPVNGRTYFREREDLAGNLDARDAVALAIHIGAGVLVPMHWDLMEGNTERAGAAADAAAEAGAPLHVMTLSRERPWAL